MPQRRELMVQLIQREGQVSISQLKEAFPKVSEMTLRRDLEILNRSGQIVRIHGGAKSIGAIVGLSEELHARRSQENVANKQIISKKALSLLKPNISIFIDSGTTTTAFAHVLPDMDMLITTSGITVAMELIHMTNVSVYLTGGKLNRNSISIT
ncbi:MAG: DeoR/GlpR family DNA-binding transcription regulator, partial [Bacillota bacterium]|nr:DeoR/GlpR family DNA-binding transcription regulator [Bacillota bacterium]